MTTAEVSVPEVETAKDGQKQRVFMRYITIYLEKGRYVAEFRGSERAKPSARVGIDRDLFEEFLKVFRVEKIELSEFKGDKRKVKEIYATDKDVAFELAMIYTYLLRVLKKEERKKLYGKIIESLLRLHMHELTFWNHHFARSRSRCEQDRVARAFLTLYNLR